MKKDFIGIALLIAFIIPTHVIQAEEPSMFSQRCTMGPHARGDVACGKPYQSVGADFAERLNEIERNLFQSEMNEQQLHTIRSKLEKVLETIQTSKPLVSPTKVHMHISLELLQIYVEHWITITNTQLDSLLEI